MDEAKQRRWEDWHLGPLAPVRKDTKYDTRDLPDRYLQNPGKGGNREKARTGRKQAGSMRLLRQPIAQRYKVGDRVCCVAMKGPAKKHRGVISTVTELRPAEKGCLVEGLNMVCSMVLSPSVLFTTTASWQCFSSFLCPIYQRP